MTTSASAKINMLEALIENAAAGKSIDLHATPVREVIQLERDNHEIDTVILSMLYRGTINDEPFEFTKSYSFSDDTPQYAIECLLIANNRLRIDHERLRQAGIKTDRVFFTFQNCFMGIPGDASIKSPALRLQDFIHLARTGIPVSVDVSLSRPRMVLTENGIKKKGFGCIAAFKFTTGAEQTTIAKLYGHGGYDDMRGDQEDIVAVAGKRLERDRNRLRNVGMAVEEKSFWHIWDKIYNR